MYDFEIRKTQPSVLSKIIWGEQPPSFEVVVKLSEDSINLNRMKDHWLASALTTEVISEAKALRGEFGSLVFESDRDQDNFARAVGADIHEARASINSQSVLAHS